MTNNYVISEIDNNYVICETDISNIELLDKLNIDQKLYYQI